MFMAIFVKKTMNRILRFGEFSKIDSAVFRLKKAEKTDDEIIYEGTLSINGDKIHGYIFCDSEGDLECYQFFDGDGKDIGETYGHDAVESMFMEKIKRLNSKNLDK